jgi:type I restriction enzyme, S subunit
MSKNTKQLVPKLRFPEFWDADEWKSEAFEDIYDFKVTNSFSRDMLNYENGSVKNIHYGDIHTKFSTLFDIEKEQLPFINPSVSIDKIKQDCYCVEGDMVFADASEDLADVGKSIELVNLNGERLVSGLHTILARQKQKKFMLGFGGHLFKSQRIRKQIQKESQGAKVLGLSSGRLARIRIAYPSDKKEQQKIADCLSSIDDLITAQSQKVEALKTHKKGLMQQLFPREGETIPRLRFPEFRDAGAWNVVSLKEACNFNPSKTKKMDDELVSFVPMSAVTEDGRIERSEVRPYAEVKKGYTSFIDEDVIIAKITPCFENGKGALARNLKNGVGFGSTEFHVFRAKENCLPDFLFMQIYRDNVRKLGACRMVGNAGHRRVPISFFEEMPFYLPSIPEQQKIADTLSNIDELISTQTQKLESLKTHKKGLMQQLFPAAGDTDE